MPDTTCTAARAKEMDASPGAREIAGLGTNEGTVFGGCHYE